MGDMRGRPYRSAWDSRLLVEVIDDNVDMRLGSSHRVDGVLYRRIDKPDQPLAVRRLSEFLRTFEPAE